MRVNYFIETRWAHGGYNDTIEIDDAELEGLTDQERESTIDEIVGDAVANDVSWGWELIE